MNIADEIRRKFANLSTDYAVMLDSTGVEYPSWAIKFKDAYGVAFEVDDEIQVNESFSSVSYFTGNFTIEGSKKHLLILSSSETELRNEFAGVCAVFLELGIDGSKRREIQENPLKWWKKWKELIGNKNVDSTVHGVLGELIALYWVKTEVVDNVTSANWTGPDGKSADILTDTKIVEVKTSLVKYNNIVTISGQFQLEKNPAMSLLFIKLEETTEGAKGPNVVSIDKMLEILGDKKLEKEDLNKKVERLGYKENSMDRKRNFRILEINEYPINESFPMLTADSFKDHIDRDRILQLTYKIELTGLEKNEIKLKIE